LALAAFEVSEGRSDPEALAQLYEKIQNPETRDLDERDNFVTDDLDNLYSSAIMGPGLNWRLDCLNRSLGPLRPGDFGFVFARPESGKTTFLADQCTFFAGQATRPVVWFNNEEQGEKVRLRTFEAALGLSLDEVWQDKTKNLTEYRKVTNNCLKIYDDADIHKSDVERVIKTWDPEVVVFDQIDKIRGFQADRPDLVYGRIYQWARVLAKGGRAIIGVCQSDGSGEGVKWLTMAHVAEAKTSKQAEADWILGIGRSNEGGTEDIRYLNISKNKLIGGPNTDPKERHGRFPVFIKPTIARYEDL
jgi:replicative DNA helicase